MTPEARIQSEIRLLFASLPYAVLWRQNTGTLRDIHGTYITYGLCVGSSDLIGLRADGRFVALEVKAPGERATPEQLEFIARVQAMGGIAAVVYSPEEAGRAVLDGYVDRELWEPKLRELRGRSKRKKGVKIV